MKISNSFFSRSFSDSPEGFATQEFISSEKTPLIETGSSMEGTVTIGGTTIVLDERERNRSHMLNMNCRIKNQIKHNAYITAKVSANNATEIATLAGIQAPTNLAPVANNSSVTTSKDAAVAITLEAHDPEGDFLVYTITTWPSNGTFVQNGGEGTYTPYAGYTGADSITFTVNDGEFTSDQATVSIEVLGNAPVIDTAASATPDTIYEFDSTALTVSASDPDGDLLTYAWSKVSGPGIATFDAPTSDFTLVSFSAVGNYVLRVTVSNGNQSVTSDVTVTVQ